MLGYAFIKILG